MILQRLEPICRLLYEVASDDFPFDAPFHSATSFECPQFSGIAFVSHTVWYSLTISVTNSLLSIAHFMNEIGMSLEDFLSFKFFMISIISFSSGGRIFRF